MNDQSVEIFRNAPVPKAVLSNAIPAMVAMMMVLVYNLADTFFIGQTNDPLMVAAVSIATPIFLLFMSVGMLFGGGGTSLISRLLGEDRKEDIKHVSAFCFWLSLIIGIVCMIGIWLFIEPLAKISGASQQTLAYTKDYFKIVAISVPFLIIGNTFSNIIRAEGNAKKAMIGMLLGNIVNIVLDPIMILGFQWGVAGAAVATVIGNVVGGLYYILHLNSKHTILSIKLKDFKIDRMIVVGVFSIGIPASLTNIFMSVATIFANNKMIAFGDMAVAGLGVAMKVTMIVMMVLVGLGMGIQPLLGYCFGAGDKKRFMQCLKFTLILSLSISTILSILCYIGAETLVKGFLQNQEALNFGISFSKIYILSGPALGILFILMNAIQSTGAGMASLIVSISRQGLIYMPILFVLDYTLHTAEWVAWAQPIADYISVVICVVIFLAIYKKSLRESN